MPSKARESKTGSIVYAHDCTINDINKRYFCCTPNCNAVMSVVNAANPNEAFFRKLPSSPDHVSYKCVKSQLNFNPTDYEESKFKIDKAFEWLLKRDTAGKRGTTGTKTGSIGEGKPGIKTLQTMYSMCANKEKNETYNGLLIDDLLVDDENYPRYSLGIEGLRIVECSFYRKIYKEPSLIMNYPICKWKLHVRINFEDESICYDQYKKLKGCKHTEAIAIAGKWVKVNGNPDYQSECIISSTRQIYYVK